MTDHSKKELSLTLLENSRISGVELKELSTKLSHRGHGLYIESQAGDRYIDLRFSSKRPFWGHGHPLMIQNEFKLLTTKEDTQSDWKILSQNEFNSIAMDMERCDLTIEALVLSNIQTNKTLLVEIDENFIKLKKGVRKKILNRLEDVSTKRPLCIFENNLTLLSKSSVSFTEKINSIKIISNNCCDFLLSQGITPKVACKDPLTDAMLDYIKSILISPSGKFRCDQMIIDQFIKSNKLENKVERIGQYLILNVGHISPGKLLEVGLLINQEQLESDFCVLSIPCSCTKNELLDTLERIKNIVSG